MAIVEANWHTYLSPHSQIPPDVFFHVKTEDGEEMDMDDESSKKTIGAHKFLLAGIRPKNIPLNTGLMPASRNL